MKSVFDFYKGKKVLVTGHTGFKGTWLCKILTMADAEVTGYGLTSPTAEGTKIFNQVVASEINSVIGDIRDAEKMQSVFEEVKPELVIHLAAQPIVLESYRDPVGTYETNVMGTVNLLECVRQSDSVRSVVNVTTDKVYENKEWPWGYRENEPLKGYDPYSNSKSCSELVTYSYVQSFLQAKGIAVSTARAGNVIGGGDFSPNRIIPDCVRAAFAGKPIEVRNPYSTRPYQHVLEPLFAYLMIGAKQYDQQQLAGSYNVGPDDCDCVTTGNLVERFCRLWGNGQAWKDVCVEQPHEATFLKLDCSLLKQKLNWQPRWHIEQALAKTIEFSKVWAREGDLNGCMDEQIREFLA